MQPYLMNTLILYIPWKLAEGLGWGSLYHCLLLTSFFLIFFFNNAIWSMWDSLGIWFSSETLFWKILHSRLLCCSTLQEKLLFLFLKSMGSSCNSFICFELGLIIHHFPANWYANMCIRRATQWDILFVKCVAERWLNLNEQLEK